MGQSHPKHLKASPSGNNNIVPSNTLKVQELTAEERDDSMYSTPISKTDANSDKKNEIVILILINFNEQMHDDDPTRCRCRNYQHEDNNVMIDLFQKLQKHIMSYRWKPFSMKFELTQILGNVHEDEQHFQPTAPFDVAISYNHDCLLVSDYRYIQIFSLTTLRFKTSIQCRGVPGYMCIEENFDERRNDAIIFNCSHHGTDVYKYQLNLFVDQTTRKWKDWEYTLWYSYFMGRVNGMRVLDSAQMLFICVQNEYSIMMLHLKSGEICRRIQLTGNTPYCLDFTNDGHLITFIDRKLTLLRVDEIHNSHWIPTGSWDDTRNVGHLIDPCSIVFDKASNCIITSDHSTIQVFTLDGTLVRKFDLLSEPFSTFSGSNHTGLCLNRITGELIVCELARKTVKIFN
ncbi:hypothetical protein C9374_008207 [Naegleria lovaniensis]|uniref:Uncharacterized protein n=1 Tax=Naegleria lovaniensis TaxID=51637 RepID=A0AA88KI68_NAELO|nr:uncharacterized protein C9374_008207 [Naegleria lovaniensis]KAG2378568.1 hypothetical protein C9374_008207 [Naegleria lovaniensis]